MAPPGTATSTTSAADTSPPSLPMRVTSCPARSQRSASPPPTFPFPTTATFMTTPLVGFPELFLRGRRLRRGDDARGTRRGTGGGRSGGVSDRRGRRPRRRRHLTRALAPARAALAARACRAGGTAGRRRPALGTP